MPSYVGAVCVQRGRVEGSHCFGGRDPQPLIAQHARSQLDPGKSFNGKDALALFTPLGLPGNSGFDWSISVLP